MAHIWQGGEVVKIERAAYPAFWVTVRFDDGSVRKFGTVAKSLLALGRRVVWDGTSLVEAG